MTVTSGIYETVDLYPTQVFDISPNYIETMDNARFVRTFGIAALAFSLLTLPDIMALNIAVSVGVGLFTMWHDNGNYYRLLSIAVLVASSVLFPFLSPLVFSFAVFWKGREVLNVVVEEKRSEDNWPLTFRRARIGTIASATGIGLAILLLLLQIIRLIGTSLLPS